MYVKASKKYPAFLITILTLGMLGGMLQSLYVGQSMTEAERYTPLVTAVLKIKLEVTAAHLWFYEHKNNSEQIEDALKQLDRAEWYAQAMLKGGKDLDGQFIPLEPPALHQRAEQMLKNIRSFRRIASETWSVNAESKSKPSIEQHFEQSFNKLILSTDDVEKMLQQVIKGQMQQFRFLQALLIIVVIVLGVIIALLLKRHENRHRKDILNLKESDEKLRTIFRSPVIGMIIAIDDDGIIAEWNLGAEKSFGYTREEMVGKPLTLLMPERYRKRHSEELAHAVKHGELVNDGTPHELVGLRKDGTEFPVELTLSSWKIGGKCYFSAIILDITKRNQSEIALKKSKNKLLAAQKLANIGHYEFNIQTDSWTSSAELDDIFGIDDNFQKDMGSWLRIVHPDFRETILNYLQDNILTHHQNFDKEYKIICIKTGREKWVHTKGDISVDSNNKPLKLFGTVHDITERKRADDALAVHLHFLENIERVNSTIQQSINVDQMMSDVLHLMLDVFKTDRAWLLYPCDPNAESWTVPMERTRPEYPGALTLGEKLPMTPEVQVVLNGVLKKKDVVIFDSQHPSLAPETDARFSIRAQMQMAIHPKTGNSWMFGMHQCSHSRDWTIEEINLFREIGHKIGDTLSTLLFLHELQESEEKWRSMTENSPNNIMLLDQNYIIQFINHNSPNMDKTSLIGSSALDSIPPNFKKGAIECFERVIQSGKFSYYESEGVSANGETRYFDVQVSALQDNHGTLTGFLSNTIDVTDQKLAEQGLRRAQKMEAIGQLTGGIAHDFNNILCIILGNIELLEEDVEGNKKALTRLASISKSAKRATDLTKQLLGFSRSQAAQTTVTNIEKVISEMESLIVRSITPEVEIIQRFTDSIWLTEIDAGDFQDALLNLVINARDAMPYGGRLTLETNNSVLDYSYCNLNPGITPGEYVELAVSDSGEGMPTEVIEHIFDPFFTTKEQGKGTGLGLSMVFGFIKRSKGHISVYSEPNIGTTFRLYLPRVMTEEPADTKKEIPTKALAGGNETILIVDDEEGMRELAQALLQPLGYKVIVASDGLEALAQLANNNIDLLFTDVVMPKGINGYDLAERANRLQPNIKILLTSGYTENTIVNNGQEHFDGNFISKPYSQAKLAQQVREILDEAEQNKIKQSKTGEESGLSNIGIDLIDDDHRLIRSMLNQCQNALEKDDIDALKNIINRLQAFTKEHFQREEIAMKVCDYPDLHNHQQLHNLLTKQIEKVLKQLEHGGLSAEELVIFLDDCLVDHINGIDHAFASYCEGKQHLIELALADAGFSAEGNKLQ